MNIDPHIWGPHGWQFMHYITIGYPERPNDEFKKNISNFFMSLKYLLPCEKCRQNYNTHISKYPLTDNILSSRKKIIEWLIDIHNEVNSMTNKSIMSYEKSLETYMNPLIDEPFTGQIMNSFKNIDSRTLIIITVLILIIIFIIIVLYRKS